MIPGKKAIACWVAAAGALLISGCNQDPPPAPATTSSPVPVRVQAVERKRRVATEEAAGTVRARLRAVIEAKVSGKIEQMLAVPGQQVKSGDLLVQLDALEIQARLDQAIAVRRQAEAELKRLSALLKEKTISQAEFDTVEARYRVADATVSETETRRSYTKVLAPFDGIVTRKYSDVGDLAAPGKPLLEIEDSSRLRLEADVPEAAVGNLAPGDKLTVRISSASNELTGVVSEISPAADPNSRTFLVKLDLPAGPGLRAGQFGRVSVPVGEARALRVPAAAVVQRGQLELVFVISDGRAQMRIVKTGKRVGNEVELVSGVDAGESVAIEGAVALADGRPVTVGP
jgi:RND family efflux transporter MFP subunit